MNEGDRKRPKKEDDQKQLSLFKLAIISKEYPDYKLNAELASQQ